MLIYYYFLLRSKSSDFARGGVGGSASSRREINNDCDIENMTFENIFGDLLVLTNQAGEEP